MLPRLELCFLQHVGGVKPALHAFIEPKRDHSAQAFLVPGKQGGPAFLVTHRDALKQLGFGHGSNLGGTP